MTTISIVDSNGATLLGPIPLAPLQVLLPNPVPAATVGVSSTYPLNASGGLPPYRWAATSSWLALAGSTLSGIPTVAGTQSVPVTVIDATGAQANGTLSIPVAAAGGVAIPPPPPPPPSGTSTQLTKILGYQSFNGGTVGKTPAASNPTAAVNWNLNDGGNPNSAISTYSTDYLDTGFATVMKQALAQGQAIPTWGSGWDYGLSKGQNGPLSMGDEIWFSMRVCFAPGFAFTTNDGFLKWMRVNTQSSSGSSVGYNDLLWQPSPASWISNFEGNAVLHQLGTGPAPVLGVWETYDFYVKLGNTAATGLARMWKNKVQVGTDWAFQTLVNATDQSAMCFNGTYWNGGNAKTQSVYTSMTAIAVNCKASGRQDVQYLATDANGKALIALGY